MYRALKEIHKRCNSEPESGLCKDVLKDVKSAITKSGAILFLIVMIMVPHRIIDLLLFHDD